MDKYHECKAGNKVLIKRYLLLLLAAALISGQMAIRVQAYPYIPGYYET